LERWTFLVIAGPDGSPAQLRVKLRDGDDPVSWPTAQLSLDGTEVAVDDVAHDYEAPEWQAHQLLDAGGGAGRLDEVKDGLRAGVAG
jgi:hypothetical protein